MLSGLRRGTHCQWHWRPLPAQRHSAPTTGRYTGSLTDSECSSPRRPQRLSQRCHWQWQSNFRVSEALTALPTSLSGWQLELPPVQFLPQAASGPNRLGTAGDDSRSGCGITALPLAVRRAPLRHCHQCIIMMA